MSHDSPMGLRPQREQYAYETTVFEGHDFRGPRLFCYILRSVTLRHIVECWRRWFWRGERS
jgi:hypothetical protein